MKALQKVQYFLSVVILTISLGAIGALVIEHIIECFTFDPYIELIGVVIYLIAILPVIVYLLSSRLPFIRSPKEDQIQRTEKTEDAKIGEL